MFKTLIKLVIKLPENFVKIRASFVKKPCTTEVPGSAFLFGTTFLVTGFTRVFVWSKLEVRV